MKKLLSIKITSEKMHKISLITQLLLRKKQEFVKQRFLWLKMTSKLIAMQSKLMAKQLKPKLMLGKQLKTFLKYKSN